MLKPIKLKPVNQEKYCWRCGLVKIIMVGVNGYCPNCQMKLYTLLNNEKKI